MIKAEIIAHSKNEFGDELVTFVGIIPRIMLAELNTHRAFSRNSSSSRAIPFEKMIKSVEENPFIPIAWQKDHKGMQGTEYLTDELSIQFATSTWLNARDSAVRWAESLNSPSNSYESVTKQLCNRLLEPFMWHTVIITTSNQGLENFFALRCPQYEYSEGQEKKYSRSWKDYVKIGIELGMAKEDDAIVYDYLWKAQFNKGQAEIHMMAFAEAMWDAYNESKPELLQAGEWHIPYKKQISENLNEHSIYKKIMGIPNMALISSVMCARVSYTVANHDLTEWTEKKYIDKAIELASSKPLHASPFEHCAKSMSDNDLDNYAKIKDGITDVGWCRNFVGFIQLRAIIEKSILKQ